jgi:hypothetical protein
VVAAVQNSRFFAETMTRSRWRLRERTKTRRLRPAVTPTATDLDG